MTVSLPFVEQADPQKPAKLPTMYDLPSQDPEEPGLPDEFHNLQPQLLSATLRLTNVSRERIFTGTDLNLYYDVQNPFWHKRPDWFVAIGVPRLYANSDLRLSYVIWDEQVNPSVIVELLSPGTDKADTAVGGFPDLEQVSKREDLGQTISAAGEPPTKWQVYERVLKLPYYVLFDRYSGILRAYQLVEERYQELQILAGRIWLPDLNIGLGLWQGEYQGISRQWLRWLNDEGNWIPTDFEQERQQRLRAEQQRDTAEEKANRMAKQLKALGVDPDQI
ncbi:MAG: Uma2 family endonuclease [Aphanocapsa sp. GSE-SYN-MK-11-07L]|jgi:Uma2 family endonuclease|nr:Uma2 family endonuclease [Aphanocapsa sp. GSE-SYN-MK-11-07L]